MTNLLTKEQLQEIRNKRNRKIESGFPLCSVADTDALLAHIDALEATLRSVRELASKAAEVHNVQVSYYQMSLMLRSALGETEQKQEEKK
jgi:hypothetical protein